MVEYEYTCPPIPVRDYDYCATLDGYEPGDAIGYGPTEQAALADLLADIESREPV